jgi:hypothetical protein
MGFESPGWEDLLYLLTGITVLASLSGAAWTLWERGRQDPWLKLLGKAAVYLRKSGVVIAPNSPPRRMADQLENQSGAKEPARQAMMEWLLRLEAQRYASPGTQRARLATLGSELNQMVRSK